ncbi:MAG: phenylalanine--tRNA ligase subunit beta [Rickettsiales bacterium]|jgi:phenylalanyl-tRNA synthetase beta chain|nr:phenylalanine--tRNA ligase subunit beta [Rickettsiales bacterium]
MKWTLDWLQDYLETDASAAEIGDSLTRIGLEVEDILETPVPIAAKIVECGDIPDTHLHLLRVDDGSGVLRTVVCGAPNARAGLVSALAVPGCKIGGAEIKAGKIRGYESNGMMCSPRELGIGDDHAGIVELQDVEIGKPCTSNLKPQTLFDAGITPNRPDYLAVRGIARDLAAAGLGILKSKIKNQKSEMTAARKVIIENPAACPVYTMCEIRDIKMAASDKKISDRLAAIGINPKNAPIDATNYVCYDMGQPMHCFDADAVRGDIIVRNAAAGERFTDLFGATHELNADDLVIADGDGILALAGIVGGARGMTTDSTKNIILESAYFSPVGIRKTAKRLGLTTDSSYRFERGIDWTGTMSAAGSAADIIMNACGGTISGLQTFGQVPAHRAIAYDPALFRKLIGIDLFADEQLKILEKLGFVIGGGWSVVIPGWRDDVQIPAGIVSEIIRIHGYDKLNINRVYTAATGARRTPAVKKILAARGLAEIVNYDFGDSEKEKLTDGGRSVRIQNPIIAQFDTLRGSLVSGMLDTISGNDKFRRSNLNLFELGTVFDADAPGAQHEQLIIARTGIFGDKTGVRHGRESDIYDVRADLLAVCCGTVENDDTPEKWAHPFRCGRIVNDGAVVARFAELHPMVAKNFGIKTKTAIGVVYNIDADELTEIPEDARGAAVPMAEFPLITRDFAFVVDSVFDAEFVKSIDSRIIETSVFDVFDLPDGKKSVAFEVVLQPESNMNDVDLAAVQNKIIAEISEKFNAVIRDGQDNI